MGFNGHPDKKATCPFEQLLSVKFDAIFDVGIEIDEDSINVECVDCPGFDTVEQKE